MTETTNNRKQKLAIILALLNLLSCSCDHAPGSSATNMAVENTSTIDSETQMSIQTTTQYSHFFAYPEVPETSTPSDSYKYVIFEAWQKPVSLSLSFDVNHYICRENEYDCFQIEKLAADFGWKNEINTRLTDGIETEYTYYYYDCGEMWVYLEIGFHEDKYSDGVVRNGLSFFLL